MNKKKTQETQQTESAVSHVSETPDTQSIEQISLRTKNVVEFAKFSYDLEEKREQSLINQSGQMLTAFSIASAALLMAIPILLDHTCIPSYKILLSSGTVLVFLLASMLLAMISQWRFKYATMMNGEELLKKVEENIENYVFQAQYDYQ